MQIKELLHGMSVKMKIGQGYRVLENFKLIGSNKPELIFASINGTGVGWFVANNEYNEDLTHKTDSRWDIVEVYDVQSNEFIISNIHAPCIWRRFDKIEITVKVNHKEVSLKVLSKETWNNIYNGQCAPQKR